MAERFLTVSYMPGVLRLWPMIRLKGLWLLQSGFSCGDKLTIRPGEILITNISPKQTIQEKPKHYVQGDLY